LSTAKTLFNTENRGFAPAVNQGLQVAQGEQVVLLNNLGLKHALIG
jgi:GT2 family glycosyltransferase